MTHNLTPKQREAERTLSIARQCARENDLDEQWLVKQAERFARYGISVDRFTTLINQACRFLKQKFLESVFESSDPKELDYCYRLCARFLNDDNLDALENMDGTLASLRQFLDENRVDLVTEGYPTTKGIAPETFEAIFGNLFFTKLPVAFSHKSCSLGRVSVKYQWDIAEVGPSLQIYPSGASEQTASKRFIDLIARPLGFPTGSRVYFRIPIGGQAINVGTYDTAWPMPFLSNEDEKRIAELRTNLFKLKQEVIEICRTAIKRANPSDVFKDYAALTAEIFTLEHIEFLFDREQAFYKWKASTRLTPTYSNIDWMGLGGLATVADIVTQTAKYGNGNVIGSVSKEAKILTRLARMEWPSTSKEGLNYFAFVAMGRGKNLQVIAERSLQASLPSLSELQALAKVLMKTEWDRELVIRYRTAEKSAKLIEKQIRETLEEYASLRGNEAVFDDFAVTYSGEGQLEVIDDYRKVIWHTNGGNIEFTFTEQQRKIVKLLHVYWRAGQISVRGRKLMEEAVGDIGKRKFADLFKSNGIKNPAYGNGSLIEASKRGMIRLNIARPPKGRH